MLDVNINMGEITFTEKYLIYGNVSTKYFYLICTCHNTAFMITHYKYYNNVLNKKQSRVIII